MIVGGGAGMGVATAVRVPFVQRVAVGAAFASAGGFYSQYKANLPCLQGLLELEERDGAEPSPLAAQTRQILRVGGPATIRSFQKNADDASRQALTPAPPPPGSISSVISGTTRGAPSDVVGGPFASDDLRIERDAGPAAAAAATSASTEASAASVPAAGLDGPAGDSWEAVRQRYQARAAGDDPSAARATREAWEDAASAAPAGFSQGGGRPRRVVKNQYGDEIVVE